MPSPIPNWALQQTGEDYFPPYLEQWKADLGISLSHVQKRKIIHKALKLSMSSKTQETNFKILARWYCTPTALKTMFPSTSDRCWRCGEARGTILHIFWSCPRLFMFWLSVRKISQKFVDILPHNPAFFLLHHTSIPPFSYNK